MTHDMNEALAPSEPRVIQGLALLSNEARQVLSATPDDFRRVVGAALYEIHGPTETSEYGRGLYYGRALGILTGAVALGVITLQQLEALMASLQTLAA